MGTSALLQRIVRVARVSAARDSADAWGGPHLDAVNLSASGSTFDELGLDHFDAATTDDFDADAERRRVASLGAETASTVGGLPHRRSPTRRRRHAHRETDLARLKADVKGATESPSRRSRSPVEATTRSARTSKNSPRRRARRRRRGGERGGEMDDADERADAAKARADAAKLAAAGIGGAATAKRRRR